MQLFCSQNLTPSCVGVVIDSSNYFISKSLILKLKISNTLRIFQYSHQVNRNFEYSHEVNRKCTQNLFDHGQLTNKTKSFKYLAENSTRNGGNHLFPKGVFIST